MHACVCASGVCLCARSVPRVVFKGRHSLICTMASAVVTSPRLRLGILSTAAIAVKNVSAAKASGAVEVVAVASRDISRAQAWATENGIPTAYGSYEELIADESIQGVFVPLPTALRKEWVIKVGLCSVPAPNLATPYPALPGIHRPPQRGSMFCARSRALSRQKISKRWWLLVQELASFSWTVSCLCTTLASR